MVPLFFFLLSLQRIWFRSSMDRMKDSGSFDWGSSPHGITELILVVITPFNLLSRNVQMVMNKNSNGKIITSLTA